jgi:PilZ domain-containing protein
MQLIAKQGKSGASRPPAGRERRAGGRTQIVCPSRYETHSEPRQAGTGHTIDMSDAGIAFTTESLLPPDAMITLHVTWPVRLEGDVPVELSATGRLARTEATRAALRLDSVSFSIAE